MPTLGVDSIELVSSLRTAPTNGAPSSDDYNDSQKENLADLTSIVSFINDVVLPLVNALQDGALLPVDVPVGIEGRTILSDTSDENSLFYDSLAGAPLTLADSLRLLNGMVENFRTQLEDMGVRVSAMQTRLASDNKNDLSLALQNLTNTINTVVSSQTALTSRVQTLEQTDGKLKTIRVTTGSVTNGTTADIAVTWAAPFADNNYTVGVSLQRAAIGDLMTVEGWTYQANGVGITVRVKNSDSGAKTATVHAHAHHD